MSKQSKLQKKNSRLAAGDQLVADYLSALVNRSTMLTANYHAKISEQRAVEYISNSPIENNSVFVTPNDIPEDLQHTIAKASLDAHMKKVQAQQISTKTAAQLKNMELIDKQKYIHKKVTIHIIEPDQRPVKSYWQNSKTGKVSTGNISKKLIKGIVEDINFNDNLLVLKPTRFSRTINPERKLFAVYVINPTTSQPMININFI